MKKLFELTLFTLLAALLFAAPAQASPVGYAAQLQTTKLKPVTNVLLLEQDRSGTVHGTFYGSDVPGNGQVVISHNPAFTPVRSLIIGITDGLTPQGADKTQIIMFLRKSFAASIGGVKWSDVFPGSSHSATIASLIAASAGDGAALAWFTGEFFTQIAAPAVFDTGAEFVVGEFSNFDVIGGATTSGPWLLNAPIVLLAANAPGTIAGHPTAVVDETATSNGPFDVQLQFSEFPPVDASGVFGVRKTVVNGTGQIWREFTLEIGTGLGQAFVRSDGTNQPGQPFFTCPPDPTDQTGAFPVVQFSCTGTTIVFRGNLNPGDTAVFAFLGGTTDRQANNVTIRQRVSVVENVPTAVPSLGSSAVVALTLLLAGLAAFRFRASRRPG